MIVIVIMLTSAAQRACYLQRESPCIRRHKACVQSLQYSSSVCRQESVVHMCRYANKMRMNGETSNTSRVVSRAVFHLHVEPQNALSLPTWSIHVSSAVEWVALMFAIRRLAVYSDRIESFKRINELQASDVDESNANKTKKTVYQSRFISGGGYEGDNSVQTRNGLHSLSIAMAPLNGSALCALTYHFFYNNSSVSFLVVVQAALTVFGNCMLVGAAKQLVEEQKERAVDSSEVLAKQNRECEDTCNEKDDPGMGNVAAEVVLSMLAVGVSGGALIKYGSLLIDLPLYPSAPVALLIVGIPSAILTIVMCQPISRNERGSEVR